MILTESISSEGGRIGLSNVNGDSVILVVPNEALSKKTNITMKILDDPPECQISNILFAGVILEPNDLILNKPALIKIKFLEDISQPETTTIFNILQNKQIRFKETKGISKSEICGEIVHFSTYAAGIPTLDEIDRLIIELILHKGDASALGVLYLIDDVIGMLELAKYLEVTGKSDKANDVRDNAMGLLEENTYVILEHTPSEPCGQYQTSLDYLSLVVEEYLGGSDVSKLLNLRKMELEQQCETEGPFNICNYTNHIDLSLQSILLDKGQSHQLTLYAYNGDGELLEGYTFHEQWWSENPAIATVQNGLVTAGNSEGSTLIYVSVCGLTASCTVNIRDEEEHTFIDLRDGQEYKWARVGNQIWMAENMNYDFPDCPNCSHCNDIIDDDTIIESEESCDIYGRLYRYEEALEVCPIGWHLPSDGEWMDLEYNLGMPLSEITLFDPANEVIYRGADTNVGGMLKESGTAHWWSPNTGATNESGLSFLPGGYIEYTWLYPYNTIYFFTPGFMGIWWAYTEEDPNDPLFTAWYRALQYNYEGVVRRKTVAYQNLSVRCIKD